MANCSIGQLVLCASHAAACLRCHSALIWLFRSRCLKLHNGGLVVKLHAGRRREQRHSSSPKQHHPHPARAEMSVLFHRRPRGHAIDAPRIAVPLVTSKASILQPRLIVRPVDATCGKDSQGRTTGAMHFPREFFSIRRMSDVTTCT